MGAMGRILAWTFRIIFALVWVSTTASAQGANSDLTALSLDELMEVNVLSINALSTHTHIEGELMLGYKFMFMEMGGNRDGTRNISRSRVLRDFRVAPTAMRMQMHMSELMYAPTENWTLMTMVPYLRLSMDHVTRTGRRFSTTSEGIGDLKIKSLYTFYERYTDTSRHRLMLNTGLSVPTGSIDEKDDTPAGPNRDLPYPMQLGSGTFDLLPGVTYLGETDNWSWGGEVIPTIRLGENSNDYTLGNQYQLSVWATRLWTEWLSFSMRLDGQMWGDIDGAHPDLNPAMVPTADPTRRGGERLDLSLGLNMYVPRGLLKGQRLSIGYGFPLYQSLDGPQLETDWRLTVGWNVTWTF